MVLVLTGLILSGEWLPRSLVHIKGMKGRVEIGLSFILGSEKEIGAWELAVT